MSLEKEIRNRRALQQKQMVESMSPDIVKAKVGQEGEVRTWSDGKKYKKQGGKWIPVSEGKDKKSGEDPKKSKASPKEGDSKAAAPSGGGEGVGNHEIAQLTHIKSIMDEDPDKAYEIFQSLSPEAQHAVPQEVVNKLVENSHKEGEDAAAAVFDDEKNVNDEFQSKLIDFTQKSSNLHRSSGRSLALDMVRESHADFSSDEHVKAASYFRIKGDSVYKKSKKKWHSYNAIVDAHIQEAANKMVSKTNNLDEIVSKIDERNKFITQLKREVLDSTIQKAYKILGI